MAWVILFFAGLFETGWAIGLKYTDGFTRLWPTVWTVFAMIISLWLLGIAVKTLPVGTAYSVWVGVGAVGTVALGIALLGEPANAARLISVGLIIAGIHTGVVLPCVRHGAAHSLLDSRFHLLRFAFDALSAAFDLTFCPLHFSLRLVALHFFSEGLGFALGFLEIRLHLTFGFFRLGLCFTSDSRHTRAAYDGHPDQRNHEHSSHGALLEMINRLF